MKTGEYRNCKVCSKEFYAQPGIIKKGYGIYCSKKCNSLDPKPFIRETNEYYTKVCSHCKKEYNVWGYRKDTSKFCSKKCMDDIRRDVIVCSNCNNEFTSPKWEKRKFCSQHCAKDFFSRMATSLWEIEVTNLLKENSIDCKNNVSIYVDNNMYNVDIVYKNKIVECCGDYWHCNPKIYNEDYYNTKIRMTAKEKWEYDRIRIDRLVAIGYDVLEIWESDYYKNKEKELKKCLTFLNQK